MRYHFLFRHFYFFIFFNIIHETNNGHQVRRDILSNKYLDVKLGQRNIQTSDQSARFVFADRIVFEHWLNAIAVFYELSNRATTTSRFIASLPSPNPTTSPSSFCVFAFLSRS